MRTLLICLTISALMLATCVAEACSCARDPDPAKQRAKSLAGADLVFKGRVLKQMLFRPEQWRCDFDDRDAPQPARGCLIVTVYGDGCGPVEGTNVSVDPHEVFSEEGPVKAQAVRSDKAGEAKFCGLPSGTYRVSASKYRQSESRLVFFSSTQPEPTSVAFGKYHPTQYRVTFAVESYVKGKGGSTQEIVTWQSDGSCGFGPLSRGETYEVFASRREDGSFWITLCGGTYRLKARSAG